MVKGNQLQLLVCSGNLGNAQPDLDSLAAWIPENGRCRDALVYPARYPVLNQFSTFDEYTDLDQFDMIVIGMQEATFDPPMRNHSGSMEMMVSDQDVSAAPPPKPKKGLTTALVKKVTELSTYVTSRDYTKPRNIRGSITGATRPDNVDGNYTSGTALLHDALERRLPSYTRAVSYQRGQMRLEVFVLTTENIQVEVVHTKAQNTGRAGLANKGGIVTELLVNGKTRLGFLTAHLEAHEGQSKYQMRCSSLADILNGTREKIHDISLTSHYCFVMGDLNFRTELPGHESLDEDEHKERIRWMVNKKNWEGLNQADELHRALRRKDCLVGFQTLHCNFPPTFKMERKMGYSYIDKRRPSYTDRILWKTGHELDKNVRALLYEPIDNFASSDHKPVRAAFAIALNEAVAHRAKAARRRSAIQLAGFSNHNTQDAVIPRNKRLQIFLSDVHCFLAEPESASSKQAPPNPYICLMSYPKEVLKESKSRWDSWRKVFSFSREKNQEPPTSLPGWPQSSVQKGTYQPLWEGEAFNAQVKAYLPDGTPLDLSGSMLRFTVMDNRSSGKDEVLGTFCYNLGNLVRTYKPPTKRTNTQSSPNHGHGMGRQRRGSIMGKLFQRQDEPQHQPEGRPGLPNRAPSDHAAGSARTARRGSLLNMVFRRPEAESQEEEEPLTTFPIDAPLIRNGQETGRIRFTMEVWWMDEKAVKMMGVDGRKSSLRDSLQQESPGMLASVRPTVTTMYSTRHMRDERVDTKFGQRKGRNGRKGETRASGDGIEEQNYDKMLADLNSADQREVQLTQSSESQQLPQSKEGSNAQGHEQMHPQRVLQQQKSQSRLKPPPSDHRERGSPRRQMQQPQSRSKPGSQFEENHGDKLPPPRQLQQQHSRSKIKPPSEQNHGHRAPPRQLHQQNSRSRLRPPTDHSQGHGHAQQQTPSTQRLHPDQNLGLGPQHKEVQSHQIPLMQTPAQLPQQQQAGGQPFPNQLRHPRRATQGRSHHRPAPHNEPSDEDQRPIRLHSDFQAGEVPAPRKDPRRSDRSESPQEQDRQVMASHSQNRSIHKQPVEQKEEVKDEKLRNQLRQYQEKRLKPKVEPIAGVFAEGEAGEEKQAHEHKIDSMVEGGDSDSSHLMKSLSTESTTLQSTCTVDEDSQEPEDDSTRGGNGLKMVATAKAVSTETLKQQGLQVVDKFPEKDTGNELQITAEVRKTENEGGVEELRFL